jgi:hypothetical protein
MQGVYSIKGIRSWPFADPGAMLEIFRQSWDLKDFRRPVSGKIEIQDTIRKLDQDGVAILENVVPTDFIIEARKDLDKFVEEIPLLEGQMRTKPRSTGGTRDYLVHEYQSELEVYRSHDPLVFSQAYAKFLMLPEVLEVLRCYFGKSWWYQAMIATRTLAVEWVGKGFDYWHHDARGRKLNIFLLLTEVPTDGAATVVLAGSHRLLYDRARRIKNSFTDQEVELLQEKFGWKTVVCSAPAGSLVFFNSHALHRGRRAPSARDAFQVNCMTKRSHLWPQEVDKEIFSSLDSHHQSVLMKHSNTSIK